MRSIDDLVGVVERADWHWPPPGLSPVEQAHDWDACQTIAAQAAAGTGVGADAGMAGVLRMNAFSHCLEARG